MKVKSYFAASVEAAMATATRELGPEAMLLHSKQHSTGPRSGEYEVVFALADEVSAVRPRAGDDNASHKLADDIRSIRMEIERMAAALGYAALANGRGAPGKAEPAQLFAALVRAGVYPDIADDLVARASIPGGSTAIKLGLLLRNEIAADPWNDTDNRIAAFVGPPGGGKTTTLTKLAVAYGVVARRPTQVISVDMHRIAAAEQLRTLCSIAGVGFQCAETPLALERAVAEHRGKALILIDTPGTGGREPADIAGVAPFLSARGDIEKHLLLPASMKPEDVSRAAERFAAYSFTHLLFTKLDETSTFGCLVNETRRARVPVSFLTAGQEIPDDIEPADPMRMSELVIGDLFPAARAATEAAA